MPKNLTPQLLQKVKELNALMQECCRILKEGDSEYSAEKISELADEDLNFWGAFRCDNCREILALADRTRHGFCPDCCEETKEEQKYDQPYWRD